MLFAVEFTPRRVIRLVEAPDADTAAAEVYPDADTTEPVAVEPVTYD